jgi:hypothetical protein
MTDPSKWPPEKVPGPCFTVSMNFDGMVPNYISVVSYIVWPGLLVYSVWRKVAGRGSRLVMKSWSGRKRLLINYESLLDVIHEGYWKFGIGERINYKLGLSGDAVGL